jgi:hypothetical protein
MFAGIGEIQTTGFITFFYYNYFYHKKNIIIPDKFLLIFCFEK